MNTLQELIAARQKLREQRAAAATAGRATYVLAAYSWLAMKWLGFVLLTGMIAVFWIIAAVLLMPLKGQR